MHQLPIKPRCIERLRKGYPWVYTHALAINKPLNIAAGEIVQLTDERRRPFAMGYYNPHTTLACRLLSPNPNISINQAFFEYLFSKALKFREARFATPYYRLVHAEGDNLPGLVIDRFADTFVCQTSTAGMERLKPIWFSVLKNLFQASRIIFRDDIPLRQKEGLELGVSTPLGETEGFIFPQENGITFYADPNQGQKTGWFYDQRANRHWLAKQAKAKTVLDLYTYSGGFGISAAVHGASQVTLVDSSQKALDFAGLAAKTNQVDEKCTFVKDNVFTLLPQLILENQFFDVVVADPPAFVKQACHQGAGLRGYQKLAKLASQVVSPQGILFIASCSHHAGMADFRRAVEQGIAKAGRKATFLRKAGADKDHPVHPLLPENAYLKALAFALD